MSKPKKTLLLVVVILCSVVSVAFAQGDQLTIGDNAGLIDSSDEYINFLRGYKSTRSYIQPKDDKAFNLDLLTYGKHYTWQVVKLEDGSEKTTIALTEEGKEEVVNNGLQVVEVVTKDGATTSTSYSIKQYEEAKNTDLTNVVNAYIAGYIENLAQDKLEEASGYRQFQSILNLIYTTIKDYLRECYSVFALGQEKKKGEAVDGSLTLNTSIDPTYNQNQSGIDNTQLGASAGKNYLKWILFSLLTIELIIVAVSSFVKGAFPAIEVVKKFFICLLILFFISNIWNITELASRVFVKGGNIAGGYDGSATTDAAERERSWYELYPGDVMEGFFKASAELDKAESTLSASSQAFGLKVRFSHFKTIFLWILFLILKLVLFVIYTITALYVLLWQTELYLLIIIATFLLPFWIFRYTNFLTKGIPQTLLGQCVKLFTATLVTRICSGLFSSAFDKLGEIAAASDWSLPTMIYCYLPGVIIISMITCYFTLKAPETARAILSGTPTSDGNIHGMATRMSTKAITMPIAMSSSKVKGLASTATTLYGASVAHASDPGKHAGRAYAFGHGGIKTGLEYMLGKSAFRRMGVHNTPYGKEHDYRGKKQSKTGIGTDPNSPNLDKEAIMSLGDKKNE